LIKRIPKKLLDAAKQLHQSHSDAFSEEGQGLIPPSVTMSPRERKNLWEKTFGKLDIL